jgi:aminoglycoside phosphotransferase (APT) family kinase protein
VVAGSTRDLQEVGAGFLRWWAARTPKGSDFAVLDLSRPSSGHSHETVLIRVGWQEDGESRESDAVIRLPGVLPTYQDDGLAMQAAVNRAIAAAGITVPGLIALEEDPQWLGATFLAMRRVTGHVPAEVVVFDPWIMDAPVEEQAAFHRDFFDLLARLHWIDWQEAGLEKVLRGADQPIRSEAQFWLDYIHWDADDAPPPSLVAVAEWCVRNAPAESPPPSLLWGDPRFGNVMCSDEHRITTMLDFDLASIGPAEMDIAWIVGLESMMARWMKKSVPGFMRREELLAFYTERLGRPLQDFEYHEIFALVRSAAINQRQARLAARAGMEYPGPSGDDNPVVRYIQGSIARFKGAASV